MKGNEDSDKRRADDSHPVATRRALIVYCMVAILGGGLFAGAEWGVWIGVLVAVLAGIGSGGALWAQWPRNR